MGQRASTNTATEVLGGLVERVTFHNQENIQISVATEDGSRNTVFRTVDRGGRC
jgi:hypothetical protein